MITDTTATHTFTLATDEQTIELSRIETPNGERLQISGDSATIRLDAMALESLTWQDDDFFTDLTGTGHDVHEIPDDIAFDLQIGNEFTFVELTRLETTKGDRLIIISPKLGYSCQCSPTELTALARKNVAFFSALLETPLGPESGHYGAH